MSDLVTYAIGDVHGEAERLARLHERIFEDIAGHGVRARVIHLGDLVDRGPDSRACVTRAMAMEEADDDIEAITLMGNHEEMMIKAVLSWDEGTLSHWTRNGGATTIASYLACAPHIEAARWREAVDDAHVDWLSSRRTIFAADDDLFVHAGIDHPGQHLGIGARGSQRAHDLRTTVHWNSVICRGGLPEPRRGYIRRRAAAGSSARAIPCPRGTRGMRRRRSRCSRPCRRCRTC
ncbi:MAG: hypothetical protein EBZ50_02005 [Alphaproteobacteria bacterium]|nr:hypothetical protein [Alphaproteobacteria bacterium]